MAGEIVVEAKVSTKQFDKQIEYIESRLEEIDYQLQRADMGFEVGDTQKLEREYEQLSNRLVDLRKKKEEVSQQPLEIRAEGLGKSFESVGKSLEKISKKVSRIGLQMLGIRSVASLLRQSFTRVIKEHPQLQAAIDHIQGGIDVLVSQLMSKIEPLLPKLIPLVDKILTLIYDIVDALSGDLYPVFVVIIKAVEWLIDGLGWLIKSLLRLAGVDVKDSATEKMSQSAEKYAKKIKEAREGTKKLRKELLGFDEMNIINEDKTTGALGALAGAVSGGSFGTTKKPEKIYEDWYNSEDTSKLQKDLYDVGLIVTTTDEKLVGAQQDLKKLIWEAELGYGKIEKKNGMVTLFDRTGKSIKFTQDEWDRLQDDIAHNRVTVRNMKIWEKAYKQIHALQLQTVGTYGKDAVKGLTEGFDDFFNLIDQSNSIPKFSTTYKNGMYVIKTETGKTFKVTTQEYDMLMKYIKQKQKELEENKFLEPFQTNIQFAADRTQKTVDGMFDHMNEKKEKFNELMGEVGTGAVNTAEVVGDRISFMIKENLPKNVEDGMNKTKNAVSKGKTNINKELGNIGTGAVTAAGNIKDQIDKLLAKDMPTSAEDGLGKVKKKIIDLDAVSPTLTSKLKDAGTTAGTSVAKGIANGVNNVVSKIESGLNGTVSAVNQLMSKMGSTAVMGAYAIAGQVNKLAKVKLPRIQLAKGGIINRPGRGVAVGGERGAEWVQPLTDEQSLDRVANAIGRRIVLQPTIPVYIGNRLVAREMRNINAQDEFAFNGGL